MPPAFIIQIPIQAARENSGGTLEILRAPEEFRWIFLRLFIYSAYLFPPLIFIPRDRRFSPGRGQPPVRARADVLLLDSPCVYH